MTRREIAEAVSEAALKPNLRIHLKEHKTKNTDFTFFTGSLSDPPRQMISLENVNAARAGLKVNPKQCFEIDNNTTSTHWLARPGI